MTDAVEHRFLDELYGRLTSNDLVLPTLPEMALRIRDLVADENSSLAAIAKWINKDPALAARVVQVANSPAFRSRATFNSVETAVTRLGGSMIKNIVTAMVMEQLFQSTTEVTDRLLRTYWRHATEVSELAMALARSTRHLQLDQAMLAGLIHDIGVLPILTLAEDHPDLLADEPCLVRLIAEAHTKLGTAILAHWHFSDDLISVAQEHENLAYQSGGPVDYVELLIVANLQSDHKKHTLLEIPDLLAVPAFVKLGVVDEEVIELMPAVNQS